MASTPLMPPQRRMWFLEKLRPGRAEANLCTGFRIVGELNPDAWLAAVTQTVLRHESLRTRFAELPGSGVRQIAETGRTDCDIRWESLAGATPAERERDWIRRLPAFARIPFDLGQLPLFRLHLGQIAPGKHLLVVVMHHIISDGDLSAELFLREILRLYTTGTSGCAEPALPRPALPPAAEISPSEASAFWQDYLDDAPQSIALPPRQADDGAAASAVPLEIPATRVARLSALAAQENATRFDVLLAAFGLLLKAHAHQDDILIGWPDPARTGHEEEIGYWGNPLPFRFVAKGQMTFRQRVAATHRSVQTARSHAHTPFEEIVQAVGGRGNARQPLFQTMFDLQPPSPALAGNGLVAQPVWWDLGFSEYEWSLFLQEQADGSIRGRLEFRPENHTAAAMAEVAQRYGLLLEQIAAQPDGTGGPWLTDRDRALLSHFTQGDQAPLSPLCAHEFFEAQAQRSPEAVAVEFQKQAVSYRTLNEEANRLARYLVRQGIGPEVVVALCVERSVAAMTAVLAIWKAGGAFLPLDPAYPPERLAFMLQDSRARILLTQEKFLPALPVDPGCRIILREDAGPAARAEESGNLSLPARHDQLNYIIYTSGSTGVPKGIAMVHRCLVNLIHWQLAHSPMRGAEVRALQFASLNFDICFQEMFTTWAAGGTVVLVDEHTRRDPVALLDYLCTHRITRLFLPFVALQQLALTSQGNPLLPHRLKQIFTAGEQLRTTPALRALLQRLPGCSLHNQYGPSEAHVITNHDLARATDTWPPLPPVGKPLLNTRLYLVDARLQPVPPGAPGEVLVGGAGLARGYLHRPDVTAEKFVPDPFSADPDARVYRTGDLARFLPDGSLEFLRRIDQQVKVRGFRIELGEVEAVIGQCPEVRETVVLVTGESDRHQLVAYVVPQPSARGAAQADAQRVSHWQTLWEDTYRNAPDSDFNLAGWTSSYTGAALPADEMRAWRDQTVRRILALRPRRVLEIGCGAGLLLTQIAPHCDACVGTDFSAEIVARLAARVQADPALAARVTVRHAEALDLDGGSDELFDTIILNSVLQLFPNADYLERVLARAARRLRPGGQLFVGDVQNLELLDAYHAGVQFHRSPAEARAKEIARQWKLAFAREDQLMVAPAFFARLPAKVPGITGCRMELKRGRHDNELIKFRYDVVLTVGHPPAPAPRPEPRVARNLAEAARLLQSDPLGPVVLRGARNARVAFDRHLLSALDAHATKAGVQAAFSGAGLVDPEDCWALAEKHGVSCAVGWSGSPDGLDAVWGGAPLAYPDTDDSAPRPLTNDPAAADRHRAFSDYLRGYLAEKLPEYMLPSHLVVLAALPMKTNGKVDRAALPAPEQHLAAAQSAWEAPATAAERALATLWEETLGVEHAGRNDDFFQLGGHSLLAVQLLFRIRQQFAVQIPLLTLFEERTLQQLARRIEAAQPAAASSGDQGPVEEGIL